MYTSLESCGIILEFIIDNAHSSIDFYLEMKAEVEVGVHDIKSRFTPRMIYGYFLKTYKFNESEMTLFSYWLLHFLIHLRH